MGSGGGHDASAAALRKQFELEYPGSVFETLILDNHVHAFPFHQVINNYDKLAANPSMWKMVYHVCNSIRPIINRHVSYATFDDFTEFLVSFNPDVLVSVHPNAN